MLTEIEEKKCSGQRCCLKYKMPEKKQMEMSIGEE